MAIAVLGAVVQPTAACASPETVAQGFFAALRRKSIPEARTLAHTELIWFGRTMSEADWSSARFAEILAQKRLRFLSSHPVQKQLLLVLPARSADRVTEELGGLGSLTCLLRTELEIAQEQLTVLVALEPAATSWCVRAVSDCSRLRTAFEEALREGTERLCDIPNPNTTRSGPLARFALGGKLASRGPKRNRRNL